MIAVRNLNKYYNKRKNNELHVLNSVSLSFGDTGLVALFGKSGSGKTTLLNCLGGLDGFDSGEYRADGVKAARGSRFNAYRRKNIGFVFQDYSLIEDSTVEDNILAALKIAGEAASVEKVNIALAAVGMARYNKRIAGTLSGGQKQRVAIARALAINPRVILADEPTGNLDKENTVRVLEILKSVSRETLVILVSHEREIVERYADRIIEIESARVISDKENVAKPIKAINPTARKIESKSITAQGITLNLHYATDAANIMRLDVAVDGDTVYISGGNKKIVSVENPHEALKNSSENTSAAESADTPTEVRHGEDGVSVRRELSECGGSVKRIKRKISFPLKSKLQKLSAVVMALTAVLIALSVSLIDGGTKIDSRKYQVSAPNAVSLALYADGDASKISALQQDATIRYLAPYTIPIRFNFTSKSLFQTNGKASDNMEMYAKPLPLNMVKESDILYGAMPVGLFDVAIDKLYLDAIFAKAEGLIGRSSAFGITTVKGFLGGQLTVGDCVMTVVGITDTNAPTIYLQDGLITALSLCAENISDRLILAQNQAGFIQTATMLTGDNEVLISKNNFDESGFAVGGDNTVVINSKTYTIKGWYETDDESLLESAYIVTESERDNIVRRRLAASPYAEAVVDGDVDAAINALREKEIYARSLAQIERENYIRENNAKMTLQLVFTVIIAVAAILCFYFSVRANIADKKKELAVKVALGIRRVNIYGQFLLSALLFFAAFALPVYVLSELLIGFVLSRAPGIFSMMSFSAGNFFAGLTILLAIPIVVTILPLIKYLFIKPIKLLREG